MTSRRSPVGRRSQAGIKRVSSPAPDWEALFQALPDPAMILGPDFSILHVNRATQQATGLSEQELKGRLCYEIFHDASRPPQGCPLAEVIASGRGGTAELEVEILKGAYRVACAPALDENGNIQNIIHLASDITERKKLAQALRASEEKFRTLADFTYGWETWLDAQQQPVYVSPACERISGYRPQEFIADAGLMERIVHPDDKEIWEQHLLRHRQGDGPDNLDEIIFRIVRRDGETRWIEHVCRAVHGADGTYLGRRASNRDITKSKQAEEALHEKEENYKSLYEMIRLIADNIPDLVWAKDMQGRYLFANQAIVEKLLIARDTEEPIGKTDLYFAGRQRAAHPENPDWHTFGELCVNTDGIIHASQRAQRFEESGNVKGEFLFLDVYKAPFWDEQGNMIGTVGIGRDVTHEKVLERESKQAEEALRIAEANYRSIFENATVGIFQSTPQGRFLSVNPVMARIFGYDTPEEMVAGVVNIEKQDYVDPADRREFQRLMIERGEAREFTSWNYRKNGERIRVQESARAVKDAQGNILYYEGFISDITERKLAEDARRQAELRYRSLFEQTHDAVFILDLEGRHLDANSRAAEMLGYTPDELLKLSFANISAQLQESRQVMERLLAGEHIPLYERIFRKKNGGLVQTEINVELVRDADGQPLHIQSVVRDITARKQIENELRESEEKYRRLVELSPDLIAIHSQGKICFANQAGLRLVGADRLEQMVGKPTLEFVAAGLRVQVAKRIQHALQNGAALPPLDEKFVRLDGSEVDVSVTAVPTTWQGKPAMQVIARDITERKLAENEARGAKDALESAHRELQQSLEREQLLARTDDLTDLYNRRYFFKHAAREFRDALHYKRPLSIIMFDVDGFKRINDSFGHLAGDKALALVAQVTAAQVRAIDVLARYGGDEFVILLPQTSAQQALAIAERVRASVAASRLETDRRAIALTLSMGIAEIIHTLQDESVESVIHRADEAMYNAKQAGSNRIVISGQ